jgi:hypothetical protein
MDTNTTNDINDDELDDVVGGTAPAQAAKPTATEKRTTEVIEHREGGARNPG